MPGVIDADTHIFEPPEMWEHIDPDMYLRRPIIVQGPDDTVYRRSNFWIIDGNIFPKPAGKGGFLLGTPTQPNQIEKMPDVRARELLDIPGRLSAMDQMGSSVQVVYLRRPIIVQGPDDTVYRRSNFWIIDGNIFPKPAGKGGFLLGTPTQPNQIEKIPPCFWPTLPTTSAWKWPFARRTTGSWQRPTSRGREGCGGWLFLRCAR